MSGVYLFRCDVAICSSTVSLSISEKRNRKKIQHQTIPTWPRYEVVSFEKTIEDTCQ